MTNGAGFTDKNGVWHWGTPEAYAARLRRQTITRDTPLADMSMYELEKRGLAERAAAAQVQPDHSKDNDRER